ncbi:FtsX-like permease family protein [Paenibacillus sonchi]|uniref:FtsX-like permease family protein n=2 Tax=Paenibacillus sonchi TaxID=373687 RepID=A0A974SBE1_9BACL|nr:FtsX-like permease family protein [Paenibacillus sonchi]
MNIVLLVLMILASTLVASSTNLMYSTTTAIDSFISKSKVADYNIITANTDENNRSLRAWAECEKRVASYYAQLHIGVLSKDITVPSNRKSISGNIGLVLSTVPEDVNLVYGENDALFSLQNGEIGLPISIMNATGLKLGDLLNVQVGGNSHTFTIAKIFKDAFMGSDLFGLKRLLISSQDFTDLQNGLPPESLTTLWSLVGSSKGEGAALAKAFSQQDIPLNFGIEKELVKKSYMPDQIISAMMFVISLFLIFIAFLTLRFTIVSTLQDNYKEIGVMKAIGLRNSVIKRLYLMKYLGLSLAGGAVGWGFSIPLSELMSRRISQYVIVPGGSAAVVVSVFSTIAIVAITLLFCTLCMRKINKASAIDAIRQGHTGERFKASRKIHLHRSKLLPPALFLALSDVLNRMKSYSALILTFVLSTAIIIIPINLMNTVITPKFIGYFGTVQADFYSKSEVVDKKVSEIQSELARVTREFRDHSFPVTLSVDYSINTKYISDHGEDNMRITAMKSEPAAVFQYLDGTAPKLANEIAITSIMADRFGKRIGDSILFEIDGKRDTFLITGLFQTITNEGYMVRLGDEYIPLHAAAYQFAGNINAPEKDKAEILSNMKQQFSALDLKSAADLLEHTTGGFMGQLQSIMTLLTVIVCLITFFITSLFVRLLIAKEVRGIAVMKSLGFKNGKIRLWQILRISILLVGSIIIGVLTANILGERLIGIIFRMFGLTRMSFNIVPLQVYLLYPLLILLVVVAAVYSSCGQIKRVQVWNMNQE